MTDTPYATGERIVGPGRAPVELLNIREVADMLGASARHVYRLSGNGRMPAPIKLGALVRWPRRVLLDWIAAGCPAVHAEGGGDQ